jgi:hypothetical protein
LATTPVLSGGDARTVCFSLVAQAQTSPVTAANLQMAEGHGVDCEDVESFSFAALPTSEDDVIFPNGKTEPVLSVAADT